MYYTDQELVLARHFLFTHQMAAVFCVKWRHGRYLEVMTSRNSDSVNRCAYVQEEHSISCRTTSKSYIGM